MPIKDQVPPENRVTLVLRAGEDQTLTLDSILPYLQLGAPVAVGRGTAIIASAGDGDALRRIELLDDPHGPFHEAVGMLEHCADELTSFGKPKSAAACIGLANDLRKALGQPKPDGLLGVGQLVEHAPDATPRQRGEDLLITLEQIARRVIERELTCGGLIARAIGGEVRP